MEAGGTAGGGGPVAAVDVRAAAAGAAMGRIRAVARVHLVLGLSAAAFALCVATLHPQLKQQGLECAATEEDAVVMRTQGLLLLLCAGAQAAAATVAAFAPDACMLALAWSFTAFAHVASVVTCSYLVGAFADAATVAVGSCPGHLHAHMVQFIFHRVLLLAPLGLFLCYGVHELIVARCAYGVYEVDDIHA